MNCWLHKSEAKYHQIWALESLVVCRLPAQTPAPLTRFHVLSHSNRSCLYLASFRPMLGAGIYILCCCSPPPGNFAFRAGELSCHPSLCGSSSHRLSLSFTASYRCLSRYNVHVVFSRAVQLESNCKVIFAAYRWHRAYGQHERMGISVFISDVKEA